jgi:hypothetical protein
VTSPLSRCDCGRPLHYTDAKQFDVVDKLVEQLGPTVLISLDEGAWRVPRHYVALHGLAARELPALAKRYGWAAA